VNQIAHRNPHEDVDQEVDPKILAGLDPRLGSLAQVVIGSGRHGNTLGAC
jgi:hypothetical protein